MNHHVRTKLASSSTDQNLDLQTQALTAAGCDIIRSEKVTGTKLEGREELKLLLTFLRKGDVLVITRIDRLARSLCDLAIIVRDLEAKGVALRALEQPIDTGSPAGRAFLQMLGVFAEFETAIRRERQLEGIAAAKKMGVYKGRKKTIKPEKVQALKAEGLGITEIANQLKISRQSVYRALS
jgi:DNA invertase Pin-like site-specific DNA recombinase